MDNRFAKGGMCTCVYIFGTWGCASGGSPRQRPHLTLLHRTVWSQQIQTHARFQDRPQVGGIHRTRGKWTNQGLYIPLTKQFSINKVLIPHLCFLFQGSISRVVQQTVWTLMCCWSGTNTRLIHCCPGQMIKQLEIWTNNSYLDWNGYF